MSTNYPSAKDDNTSIPVESTGTPLSTNHIESHTNVRSAIIALETKVGVDGSAVTTSHDYKLSNVSTGDKAVSLTGEETIKNKTLGAGTATALGSDATGDMYYRDSNGDLARLAKGNTNDILTQGETIPEWTSNPATTDASKTERGVVELATQAELDAGTDTGGAGSLVPAPSTIRAKKYHDYAVTTGSANAYVLDVSPSITAYSAGQEFTFEANFSNTGSATINIDSLGAKTLKDPNGNTMLSGWIQSGGIYKCVYDGTDMIVVSPLNKTQRVQQDEYVVSMGINEASTTINCGFPPRVITYQIACSSNSSGETSWSSGTFFVTDTTYATVQQETGSAPQSHNNSAHDNTFSDSNFTVTFDTFTSTGYDITVSRNGTWQSGGTINVTAYE